jgi:DNA transposition AAA+ family ATPase
MDIIKTIKSEIAKCPLSHQQLSRAAGVDPSALCRFLQGKHGCSAATANKLLNYFGYVLKKQEGGKHGGN